MFGGADGIQLLLIELRLAVDNFIETHFALSTPRSLIPAGARRPRTIKAWLNNAPSNGMDLSIHRATSDSTKCWNRPQFWGRIGIQSTRVSTNPWARINRRTRLGCS